MRRLFSKRHKRWNIERRRTLGERFLAASGAPDLAAAKFIAQDSSAAIPNRCLAVRALGLLSPTTMLDLNGIVQANGDTHLRSACLRALHDWERRAYAESREYWASRLSESMKQSGCSSMRELIEVLRDPSQRSDLREEAARALGHSKCREALGALLYGLDDPVPEVALACAWALHGMGSRSATKPLLRIIRGRNQYSERLRLEAIVAMWGLGDPRAEADLIRVSSAVGIEDEYARDRATEALSRTIHRRKSQEAIAARLFDPSPLVRFAALCACCWLDRPSERLWRAVTAKLDDPDRIDDHRVMATQAANILQGWSSLDHC